MTASPTYVVCLCDRGDNVVRRTSCQTLGDAGRALIAIVEEKASGAFSTLLDENGEVRMTLLAVGPGGERLATDVETRDAYASVQEWAEGDGSR